MKRKIIPFAFSLLLAFSNAALAIPKSYKSRASSDSKPVHVKSYKRKDGRTVGSYKRAYPGEGTLKHKR